MVKVSLDPPALCGVPLTTGLERKALAGDAERAGTAASLN